MNHRKTVVPGYSYVASVLTAGLCSTRKWNFPAGKHEYGRMAL